jgi:hypothetical protein
VLSIRGALLLASDIPNVIDVLIILISCEGRENIVIADIAVGVGPAISTGCPNNALRIRLPLTNIEPDRDRKKPPFEQPAG